MLETLSFTKRYILALTIIAMLSTLAYFNLNHLLSIQSNDAKIINISGRQRIFTKQIAFFAIYYKIDALEKNIVLMENSHKQLLAFPMSKNIKEVYFGEKISLDKKITKYLFHAKKFAEKRDGRSQNYVLQNSENLLLDIEKIVSTYLNEAEENTNKLKRVELYIFMLTLFTLFCEAIFIFRPANKRINKKNQELTSEKDYSNAVIESSTNAIITLDGEHRIRTFNKMAENIFGYRREEMLHQSSFEKIIPKKYKIEDFEHTGEVKEIEAINKNGQQFPIRISFGTTGHNQDIAIVANIQDITKEKLNSRMLQQQAKFAALGEMIAIIAHQWRQPLAELNFNCMYISEKLTDPELKIEAAKNEEIIQFMSDTITCFENFYKQTDNSIFKPSAAIEQALKIIGSLINLNQIELIKDIDSDISIYGNSNSLAHVVLSIVQNIVDIIIIRDIVNPYIEITLKKTHKNIILSIKDNGGGISVQPVDDIFKPFKSKKLTPSTGIGLYMSRLVIEDKFRGVIQAQNIDAGALFVIKLPKASI